MIRIGARPVLGSPEELADWAEASRHEGRRLPAAIHVDTGMNRLGFPVADALALPSDPRLGEIAPCLLISHFTSAEEPGDPGTARQVEAFAALRTTFPGLPGSLANSSGIFLDPAPRHDLVRPGYALFGGNPTPSRPNPMRPVVRLDARIVQIREIAAGESVGYNRGWTARTARRLATLLGRLCGRLSARGHRRTDAAERCGAALVAGRLCPFAGRVSMDLIVIDVTFPGAGASRRPRNVRDADRRHARRRRGRPAGRHDRLRGPDRPRLALRGAATWAADEWPGTRPSCARAAGPPTTAGAASARPAAAGTPSSRRPVGGISPAGPAATRPSPRPGAGVPARRPGRRGPRRAPHHHRATASSTASREAGW